MTAVGTSDGPGGSSNGSAATPANGTSNNQCLDRCRLPAPNSLSATERLGSERSQSSFACSTRAAAVRAPCRPGSRIARPKSCRRYIQSSAMYQRQGLDLTQPPALMAQDSARPDSATGHNWRKKAGSVRQRLSAFRCIREHMPAAIMGELPSHVDLPARQFPRHRYNDAA